MRASESPAASCVLVKRVCYALLRGADATPAPSASHLLLERALQNLPSADAFYQDTGSVDFDAFITGSTAFEGIVYLCDSITGASSNQVPDALNPSQSRDPTPT